MKRPRGQRINAMDSWTNMKVGHKLSFLLFEGTVSNIKLEEQSWEESPEIVIPEDKEVAGYNTDIRTVVGGITKIEDEILVIDTGNNQELYVPLTESDWFFKIGDVVSLNLFQKASH